MKFGFIAGKAQKSFDCLAERAQSRGHEVVHIPLRDMTLSENEVSTFAKACVAEFDALHYYAGAADPIGIFFGKACDDMGVTILNNRARIPHLTHDKMYQTLTFVRAGLPVPKTEFSRQPNWETLSASLGSPFVAKRVRGTHGKHVHVIEKPEDLTVVDMPSMYLFQEFLLHNNDIRVLVLHGKAIAAYKRIPAAGDFRANLARGGHAEAITDKEEQAQVFALAEVAAKAMPLELAGVDLIKSEADGTHRLIEINTNPSWYGLNDIIDAPFEDALLDAYEQLAAAKPV
jgi:ribosomal protein S6--L-glutamate ligase